MKKPIADIKSIPIPEPLLSFLLELPSSESDPIFEWLLSAEVVTEEMLKYYGLYKGGKK